MGYRSEVVLAIAFDNKEQMDEVWAVYCMNPKVQEHNIAAEWKQDLTGNYPVLWFSANSIKWYESYEDVVAFEELQNVAESFSEERKFNYAYCKYRIGEDIADVETEESASELGDHLSEYLWDNLSIERTIHHSFC